MSDISVVMSVFLVASALAVLIALYGIAKLFVRIKKRDEEDQTTNVGFVVDTFHGLVAQLKEKEKELEVLRERAEERAGIIEDYNENILQSVPSGVITLDEHWRIVKANSSAGRILGVKVQDLIGVDSSEIFTGELDLRERGAVERGESQFLTPSGKRLWLGYALSPLKDAEGSPIGQLLIFTDLTELKALQSQAELRQRLSSLGEMAAGIAHEMRNPMGVISGYMRLLARKVPNELAPTVEAVSAEVDTMDRIISDFLSFARPRDLDLSELDLADLIQECVSSVDDGGKGIQVGTDVERGLVVRADSVLLRQAFTNLLQNAMEAVAGEGGVSLSSVKVDGSAYISISDTGHGIDEGIRERIFLPFFTTKEKGTGLGLAIVHRIITTHGGDIDIESDGGGTTFTIRLPLQAG